MAGQPKTRNRAQQLALGEQFLRETAKKAGIELPDEFPKGPVVPSVPELFDAEAVMEKALGDVSSDLNPKSREIVRLYVMGASLRFLNHREIGKEVGLGVDRVHQVLRSEPAKRAIAALERARDLFAVKLSYPIQVAGREAFDVLRGMLHDPATYPKLRKDIAAYLLACSGNSPRRVSARLTGKAGDGAGAGAGGLTAADMADFRKAGKLLELGGNGGEPQRPVPMDVEAEVTIETDVE